MPLQTDRRFIPSETLSDASSTIDILSSDDEVINPLNESLRLMIMELEKSWITEDERFTTQPNIIEIAGEYHGLPVTFVISVKFSIFFYLNKFYHIAIAVRPGHGTFDTSSLSPEAFLPYTRHHDTLVPICIEYNPDECPVGDALTTAIAGFHFGNIFETVETIDRMSRRSLVQLLEREEFELFVDENGSIWPSIKPFIEDGSLGEGRIEYTLLSIDKNIREGRQFTDVALFEFIQGLYESSQIYNTPSFTPDEWRRISRKLFAKPIRCLNSLLFIITKFRDEKHTAISSLNRLESLLNKTTFEDDWYVASTQMNGDEADEAKQLLGKAIRSVSSTIRECRARMNRCDVTHGGWITN